MHLTNMADTGCYLGREERMARGEAKLRASIASAERNKALLDCYARLTGEMAMAARTFGHGSTQHTAARESWLTLDAALTIVGILD